MGKVLNVRNLLQIKQEKDNGSKIVPVGGCFDILHAGHIEFLRRSKALGDKLIILLESDDAVKKLKGEGKPINKQITRAKILSNLGYVDFVIKLNPSFQDKDYGLLVKQLEPDIIALTRGNKIFNWEKKFMEERGGKIIIVMNRLKKYSTRLIAQRIKI